MIDMTNQLPTESEERLQQGTVNLGELVESDLVEKATEDALSVQAFIDGEEVI